MKNYDIEIHKELAKIFDELGIPNGKGYFIGTGDEPVFIVYLPYSDEATGRAEDQISQITRRLKVDIISRNGANFLDTEIKVREILEKYGYDYRNGDEEVDFEEPYNYHRTLYYNKNYFVNSFEENN